MQKKLHPGVKVSWRISSYFTILFLSVFLAFWSSALFLTIGSGLSFILTIYVIIVVLLIILLEVWIRLSYNRWFYEFTADNLKIEHGVITKRYSNLPYERVQNVDIRRGIIARIFGFSSVMIQTAGYSLAGPRSGGFGIGSEGFIPAVDVKEAENIRDFLMKKISKRSKQGL